MTCNPCNLPDPPYDKLKDPYRFVTVEDFFSELDSGEPTAPKYHRIENVELCPYESKQQEDLVHHGAAFRDDNHKVFLIQFIRPTVFRIQFNPEHTSLDDYSDGNSRNLVQDTMAGLIAILDKYEHIRWQVDVEEVDVDGITYIKLESRPETPARDDSAFYYMRIYVRKRNFKIIAIQRIRRHVSRDDINLSTLGISSSHGKYEDQVVWRSKAKGILYLGKTTIVEVHKPGRARYLGFGEQGGSQLLKTKVKLDYFTYDNMKYQQVYGKGPLDSREPLYHSEPFWMEIAQHPDYLLKIANFVDNYSQVYLDVGSRDNSTIRVVTRFDNMQLFVVVGDSIGQIIRKYTSIVGRPQLKPRYVLGNHQGCYGYDTKKKIQDVVDGYHGADFPLDGMHIDVDFQREYKTFTVNEDAFPDPGKFLKDLRKRGIKCSTNITPFINGSKDPSYHTLNDALEKGYFMKDHRCIEEGGPVNAHHDYYIMYSEGERKIFKADDLSQEPRQDMEPPDNVEICATWNTGKPYRGGVYYGNGRGKPGHYPDLNRKEVRLWWGEQYDYLISLGLEFVWQDMTSPCMGASYGDMKSFPFRMKLTSNAIKGISESEQALTPAIKIWALYALNLHKATYNGWNHNQDRAGRRNFIIGRGGFIGLHRYAGLWTGDNASDWDFLKVSVGQILSLGLSGITISGGDVGGFEFGRDKREKWQKWADPELLMRWYCAYSLLPWFRNHYIAKDNTKCFQEPFRYIQVIDKVPEQQKWLYRATLPVCRYYVKLRYTLLQLLYDQMFDNLLTGLPIARSLIISNEDDGSLVTENSYFLDDEYMVGDDLLVAPVLHRQGGKDEKLTRQVYLPRPNSWWLCNLHADGPDHATPLDLKDEHVGGSLVPCSARLDQPEVEIPLMTPMFIKFGAIIPQIEPRLHVEDPLESEPTPNPVSVHFYPGHHHLNRSYDMYLDDGVSRNSAPTADGLQSCFAFNQTNEWPPKNTGEELERDAFGDEKADNVYWKIRIQQNTTHREREIVRQIHVETICQSDDFDPVKMYGPVYRLIIWGEPKHKDAFSRAKLVLPSGIKAEYNGNKNVWFIELPIAMVKQECCRLECSYALE